MFHARILAEIAGESRVKEERWTLFGILLFRLRPSFLRLKLEDWGEGWGELPGESSREVRGEGLQEPHGHIERGPVLQNSVLDRGRRVVPPAIGVRDIRAWPEGHRGSNRSVKPEGRGAGLEQLVWLVHVLGAGNGVEDQVLLRLRVPGEVSDEGRAVLVDQGFDNPRGLVLLDQDGLAVGAQDRVQDRNRGLGKVVGCLPLGKRDTLEVDPPEIDLAVLPSRLHEIGAQADLEEVVLGQRRGRNPAARKGFERYVAEGRREGVGA